MVILLLIPKREYAYRTIQQHVSGRMWCTEGNFGLCPPVILYGTYRTRYQFIKMDKAVQSLNLYLLRKEKKIHGEN